MDVGRCEHVAVAGQPGRYRPAVADQLLGDVWLLPRQAVDQGFTFRAPDVSSAIAQSLRR